jgi:hypothetical protein
MKRSEGGIGSGGHDNSRSHEMTECDLLIEKLQASSSETFWHGKADEASISHLAVLLGVKLPDSFRHFLAKYGGGGVVGEEISGIEDNDPKLKHRGTVYGDTLTYRADYGLPTTFVVIYLVEGEAAWCLDVSQCINGECPVVAFDLASRGTTPISDSFGDFLKHYLTARLQHPDLEC